MNYLALKKEQFHTLNDFVLQNKIGSGSFGNIYKVKSIKSGKIFVAKISINKIEKNSTSQLHDISREVNILSKLNHPSILKFIFYSPQNFKKKPKPVIITEFAPNGSLDELIKKERHSISSVNFNMTHKLIIIYGIAAAMKYLHANNIIHRDLKPGNILLDEFLFPKVGDFGLSKVSHKEESMTMKSTFEVKGTPIYMSPEIWSKAKYTKAGDVYAFSIIIYELITNLKPFENINFYLLPVKVTKGFRPDLNNQVPEAYSNLIRDCWSQDPEKRPTFDDILNRLINDHGFITKDVNESEYFKYVKYINEYNSSFDKTRNVFYFNLYQNKVKVSEIDENTNFNMIDKRSLFPYKEYVKLNEESQKIVDEANEDPEKQFNIGISLIEGRENFPLNTQIGLKFLQKSMENGCIKSIIYYCEMLIKGRIIPQNLEKAMKIAQKYFTKEEAAYSLIIGKIEKKKKNYEKAKICFEKSINEGNDESMYQYGKMFYKGIYMQVNKEKAIFYYKKAIEKGNVKAMFEYGKIMKKEGQNDEGNRYIKKSADEGYPKACYYYSIILDKGDGVAINKEESIRYLHEAAKKGNDESMYKYSLELSKNYNFIKDSVVYLKKLCDKGHNKSMYYYGKMLLKGDGIQKNIKEAIKYIKLSAISGNTDAMIYYGDILSTGDIVSVNKEEAIKYYKMAIEKGNEEAKNKLSSLDQHQEKESLIKEIKPQKISTIKPSKENTIKPSKVSTIKPPKIPIKPPKIVPNKPPTRYQIEENATKLNTINQSGKPLNPPIYFKSTNILKTMIVNGHEAGIYTEKVEPRADICNKYLFYFTGGSKDMLLKGIEVDLDSSYDFNQCNEHLLLVLKDIIDITNMQLIIYLPGGIPFNAGTLGKYSFNKVIYGVLTRRISKSVLKASCPELCNIKDQDHKLLISPLVDSTDRGFSDMACLMGYLNHGGIESDVLLRTCAAVIHFPPLITSMRRIIDQNKVIGQDVINVTSTLYTFFRAYLPITCPDNNVYEYALRMCNLISHINEAPKEIPLLRIDFENNEESEDFNCFKDLDLGPIVYFWKGDTDNDFQYYELKIQGEQAIENAYNCIASFTPIMPLSLRTVEGCTITKGKYYEYFYLMNSSNESILNVDIIDPMIGLTETKNVEQFAKEQGPMKFDNIANLIEPDNVKQIIMINFDESKSMIGDLDGYCIQPDNDNDQRITIAYQYLTSFANKTYNYHLPCIQGLISFNNDITVRCPLGPLIPDFEIKGLKNIKPNSITKLWDSLHRSCEEIIQFRKDRNGNELYKNAISRILVISDGEDINSSIKVQDVVKELLINKIIVDSIIISNEEECMTLCAVCHITGGLSIRPKTVNEGLAFIEKDAFLNYEERIVNCDPLIPGDKNTIPNHIHVNMIDDIFIKRVSDYAKFDEDFQNKIFKQASSNVRLATPHHICSKYRTTNIPNPRQRRILRELHAAARKVDPDSPDYDPEMKVFTFLSRYDIWKVCFKGYEGTPYENKWWLLYVTFPELYPVQPPDIRFVSVPYHINVSDEGRIC